MRGRVAGQASRALPPRASPSLSPHGKLSPRAGEEGCCPGPPLRLRKGRENHSSPSEWSASGVPPWGCSVLASSVSGPDGTAGTSLLCGEAPGVSILAQKSGEGEFFTPSLTWVSPGPPPLEVLSTQRTMAWAIFEMPAWPYANGTVRLTLRTSDC